jgi:ribosomal protein L20
MDMAKKANIALDRKILSTLAKDHPSVFAKIVEKVK